MRVLRYLQGTKHWTLNLGGRVAKIAGYTDSDGVPTATIEIRSEPMSSGSETPPYRGSPKAVFCGTLFGGSRIYGNVPGSQGSRLAYRSEQRLRNRPILTDSHLR